ncbi:MAG: hypothetical protein ABSG51_14990, partial [Terracidiphilus sp.]
ACTAKLEVDAIIMNAKMIRFIVRYPSPGPRLPPRICKRCPSENASRMKIESHHLTPAHSCVDNNASEVMV